MNKKDFNGFYFRCVACDRELDLFQQETGVCTTCKDIVYQTNDPWAFGYSEHDIKRMFHPPMGDIDEFFQDVENEYNGYSD